MKILFFIFSLLTITCSRKSDVKRYISIKPIGWEFEISNQISFNDSAFNREGQLIEPKPGGKSPLRLLLSKSDKGYFAAFIWKDSLSPEEWRVNYDADTKWYFNEIKQLPQVVILDSKYSTEQVGDVDFLVQYVKSIKKKTNDTVYSYHYFGRFKDYGMDISFEYDDSKLGKSYHGIVSSSKFLK